MVAKSIRVLVFFSACALVLAGCAGANEPPLESGTASPNDAGTSETEAAPSQEANGQAPGNDSGTLPEFTAETLSGEDYSSSTLSENGALIWFWTPWCAICAQESADIVAIAESNPDLLIIGIAGYGSQDEMTAFTTRTKTNNLAHLNDSTGALWSAFQVPIQPSLVAVNRAGELRLKIGPSSAKDIQAFADWVK